MHDFRYHRPGSVDEAVELLRGGNGGAKLMAGGQSLLPLMKLDLAEPGEVVSLAELGELRGIREEEGALVVGAATTHTDVETSEVVRRRIPALSALAGQIGDPQVRNRGTLGGSVAHADPAADYPAALVGLDATVTTDRREIAADDFFTGMFGTALESDEVILSVRFPVPDCAAYAKFPNPASRYALAGVLVARTDGGVRVAVTGAGASVFRLEAVEERLASDFRADAVGDIDLSGADLLDDADASAEYRGHLVGVMTRRAVAACE